MREKLNKKEFIKLVKEFIANRKKYTIEPNYLVYKEKERKGDRKEGVKNE